MRDIAPHITEPNNKVMPTSTAVHKSRRANGPRSNAQIRQGNAKRRLERSGGETGNRFLGMWEISDVPKPLASRAHPHPHKPSPTKIHELDIIGDDATGDVIGAPLTLDFEKIFLREPRQGQGDIVFNIRDPKAYAANVWRGIE